MTKNESWPARVADVKPGRYRATTVRSMRFSISPSGAQSSPTTWVGDDAVSGILSSGKIKENTATFCLLDQRTFECEWRTVELLAKHKAERKIEVFYFLGTGWLDRSIKATKDHDRLRRWWGGDGWQALQPLGAWDRAFAFCERFKGELGYVYAHPWPIYSKEQGGRVLYYMIHATDHPDAPKLMNRAYFKANEQRESEKALQISFEQMGMVLPEQRRPV